MVKVDAAIPLIGEHGPLTLLGGSKTVGLERSHYTRTVVSTRSSGAPKARVPARCRPEEGRPTAGPPRSNSGSYSAQSMRQPGLMKTLFGMLKSRSAPGTTVRVPAQSS